VKAGSTPFVTANAEVTRGGSAMARKSSIIIAALTACAAATVGMGSAAAATQVPFTITETNIQFFDTYDTGDFTTTGPLCPSGTFIDTYRALAGLVGQQFQHPLEHVTGDAVYTCADGSGTFHLLKTIRLAATPPGIDVTGPVSFQGGTGAYGGLTGYGVDNGINGEGHISGNIVRP
jgi:hypothetical protein